ncbi:MAG: DUF922 domain-containing protein [Bacteroidetes bacterium]|nr:DUF922 domain-containing protein [Bacteroidota bacterium]
MSRFLKAFIALAMVLYAPLLKAWEGNVIKPEPFEKDIIVLDPNDPLPSGATELKDVEIDGKKFKTGYSYLDMMQTLKKKASEQNANIIKITEKVLGEKNECCKVSAILYRAEDIHKYEKEFNWSKDRKLTWADFGGRIYRTQGAEEAVAVTYCGFGFETNTVTVSNKVQILVRNSFRKDISWVMPDERTPEVLEHEQGHFDLCEIYTRKLRERFNGLNVTVYNLNTTLADTYKKIGDEYKARQDQYEKETHNGQDRMQQKKWERVIAKELDQTADWMM